MGGEELRAEFERLGEAEVIARISDNTFDQYSRAYALRWLSDHALSRVLGEETAAVQTRLAAQTAARRARRLIIFAVAAICALVAALLWYSVPGAGRPGASRAATSTITASPQAAPRTP